MSPRRPVWVLPAGTKPPNPAELLGSKRFRDFAALLLRHFDWVILDTPPVMAVTDASIAANISHGVLFVVGAEMTSRRVAQRAIEQLSHGQARFPRHRTQPGKPEPEPLLLLQVLSLRVRWLLWLLCRRTRTGWASAIRGPDAPGVRRHAGRNGERCAGWSRISYRERRDRDTRACGRGGRTLDRSACGATKDSSAGKKDVPVESLSRSLTVALGPL